MTYPLSGQQKVPELLLPTGLPTSFSSLLQTSSPFPAVLGLVNNSPMVADPKLQFSADPKYSVREISGSLFVSGQH